MGNVLADCQRYGIQQCELCSEVHAAAAHQDGPVAQRRAATMEGETAPATFERPARNPSAELSPQGMSEHDMLQQALRLSRREALVDRARRGGPTASRDPGGARGRRAEARDAREELASPAASLDVDGTRGTDSVARAEEAAARAAEAAARAQERREQELVEQAIHRSRMEEENRQRTMLISEQESEYEESLRIDREKAEQKALKEKEEEERARREAEEQEAIRREQAQKEAEAAAEAERRQAKATEAVADARGRLREEPAPSEAGRVLLQIRLPEGRRLKRAFRAADPVEQIYLFARAEAGEALAAQEFRLVSPLPRCTYEDRSATLGSAGLTSGTSLLVEMVEE